MPVTTRVTPPSPSIFTSDPLEQIFARDMFAPGNKGGLAYMMLNAAETGRDRDRAEYQQGLDKYNQQAGMLERLEMAFHNKEELQKLAAGLIPHGILPSTMPAISELFGGHPETGDPLAMLVRAKMQAEINHQNAAAAAAGQGGADQSTIRTAVGPPGTDAVTEISYKSRNPNAALEKQQELVRQLRGGTGTGPNAGGPITSAQKQAYQEFLSKNQYVGH